MRHHRGEAGFNLLELVLTIGLLSILIALAYTSWSGYNAHQQVRYGTVQVATDLREAEERAKSERTPYTVTFTASSGTYSIARNTGGFLEHATLPGAVVPIANTVVTFSDFGVPDAAHSITVQNAVGSGTASIDVSGGITYQGP